MLTRDPKSKKWTSRKYRRWIRDHGRCFVCGLDLINEKPDYISHHHRHASKNDAMLVQICLKHHNEFNFNESKFNETHMSPRRFICENSEDRWMSKCLGSLEYYLRNKKINTDWVILNAFMKVAKENE